jgi:hypothetical protein
MNRGEAGRAGLKHYDATIPCRTCGGKVRYVTSGRCVACANNRSVFQHCTQILSLAPRTREEAVAIGSKFYRTGDPCRNGHRANRWTRNSVCVACNHEARAKIRGGYKAAQRAAGWAEVTVLVPVELEETIRDMVHWQVEAWRLTCPPVLPPETVRAPPAVLEEWPEIDPTH